MYVFEIETKTQSGKYVFLTRANNGKDALNNLIEKSGDFKFIINKKESNDMTITIKKGVIYYSCLSRSKTFI